jgi:hypothetical protein
MWGANQGDFAVIDDEIAVRQNLTTFTSYFHTSPSVASSDPVLVEQPSI